jgi:acyl-CoA dehydrogenase
MDAAPSPRVSTLHTRLHRFLQTVLLPQEAQVNAAWRQATADGGAALSALLAPMQQKAQMAGLWNLFLPASTRAPQGLSHWEYAPMIEAMGQTVWAAVVFNCAQPDAATMQLLDSYASEALKDAWLDPMLRAQARCAWAAAEPGASLHHPDTLQTEARTDGDHWIVHGSKTWVHGLFDASTTGLLVLCRTDASAALHRQFSLLLVPRRASGVLAGRQRHGWATPSPPADVRFDAVRVPLHHVIGEPGQGLEMLQVQLRLTGLHDALWCLGAAERALRLLIGCLQQQRDDQAPAVRHPLWQQRIAQARIGLDTTRMLARRCAWLLDQNDGDLPQQELAMLQLQALPLAVQTVQWSILAHDAQALDDTLPLAGWLARLQLLQQLAPPAQVLQAQIAQGELLR